MLLTVSYIFFAYENSQYSSKVRIAETGKT